MRKALLPLMIIIGLVAALFFYSFFKTSNQERPTGITGVEAESLAKKIETAIAMEKWSELDAVYFEFYPLGTQHFLDRKRGLAEIIYKEDDDTYRVLFELKGTRSRVWKNNAPITGDEAEGSVKLAREYHKREYFWLNPMEHIRDENVILKKVGELALLVSFLHEDSSEGDAYLFVTDPTGRPTHIKIWASTLPIQGMEASLEQWEKLENGAWISLMRETFLQEIRFEKVEVYNTYPLSPAEDRFAPLFIGE